MMATLSWAALCGLSAWTSLSHWQTEELRQVVVVIFSAGGLVALPAACAGAWLVLRRGSSKSQQFAAFFVCLTVMTIGTTSLIFALVYRSYYAAWHADTFSYVWFLQLIFTTASALYQFATTGLRCYFPWGFVGLFAFSLWFAWCFTLSLPASSATRQRNISPKAG
ncbi:hypothetical protein [Nitratireductor basaltis]|nr:hypothetical protein [Nitratireductor basaltis]